MAKKVQYEPPKFVFKSAIIKVLCYYVKGEKPLLHRTQPSKELFMIFSMTDRVNVVLRPVTDEKDCKRLADIDHAALSNDPLLEWYHRYQEDGPYESALKAITEAVSDSDYHLLKAVIFPEPLGQNGGNTDTSTEQSTEPPDIIVGFVHYLYGYIELDKVDPFNDFEHGRRQMREAGLTVADQMPDLNAQSRVSEQRDDTQERPIETVSLNKDKTAAEDADRAYRLSRGEARYDHSRQFWVRAIRGKKHIYIKRIMVDPAYQGRGIGAKLMKALTDEADRAKIPCWLFSRPAGEPLYYKVGFQLMGTTEMSEPGFDCAPCGAMLRPPQPILQ